MRRQPAMQLLLALMRSSCGEGASARGEPGREIDLDAALVRQVDWHAFVALATAHFVLPAIAPAVAALAQQRDVPADLVAFAADFRAANEVRNGRLKLGLAALAERLARAGVIPVALKGAAFLADDAEAIAGWRFMSDLDLLVRPEELAQAVAIAEAAGFRSLAHAYEPETQAHFPPLLSPCGAFTLELHTRLFGLGDYGIDIERLRAASVPAPAMPDGLRVPAARDRILHAVMHAQLHNRNLAARRLVLKDVLDLAMLPQEAVNRLARDLASSVELGLRERAAAGGLLAAARHCLGVSSGPDLSEGPAARWAERVTARLHWPRWRLQLAAALDIARVERDRLRHEPGHLSRRLRLLRDGQRLGAAAEAWSFKQRQRLWSGP